MYSKSDETLLLKYNRECLALVYALNDYKTNYYIEVFKMKDNFVNTGFPNKY